MNLFFNTGAWGYYVVCALSLPLLASAVTALFFYKRWWQRWFAFKWSRGAAVLWSDLHKTGGLWSLWFIAVIALWQHASDLRLAARWVCAEAIEPLTQPRPLRRCGSFVPGVLDWR